MSRLIWNCSMGPWCRRPTRAFRSQGQSPTCRLRHRPRRTASQLAAAAMSACAFCAAADHVHKSGGKSQDDKQDQQPRPRAELPVQQPTDKPADADADQKLGDEPKGPGESLAAGTRFRADAVGARRAFTSSSRFPIASERLRNASACSGLISPCPGSGSFPSDDMLFTGPIAGSRLPNGGFYQRRAP